ncbi:MAG TPA: hypothetical protein HA286_03425, partial [Candidatus Poseidoniaceae archaeon]
MAGLARTALLALLMFCAPLSGCVGNDDDVTMPAVEDLVVRPDVWPAGEWTRVTFSAEAPLSVFVPHFLRSVNGGYVQNGTVLNLDVGDEVEIEVLPSARLSEAMLMLAPIGTDSFPIRDAGESWESWTARGGPSGATPSTPIAVTPNNEGGEHALMRTTNASEAGEVLLTQIPLVRGVNEAFGEDEGQAQTVGWVNGRDVYDWLEMITDETPDPTDPYDGAVGYLDRWVGNGVPAYEDAIAFFSGVLEGYGLRTEVQRFQANTGWAVNICGYKDGSLAPDEWLVFGAHFDV